MTQVHKKPRSAASVIKHQCKKRAMGLIGCCYCNKYDRIKTHSNLLTLRQHPEGSGTQQWQPMCLPVCKHIICHGTVSVITSCWEHQLPLQELLCCIMYGTHHFSASAPTQKHHRHLSQRTAICQTGTVAQSPREKNENTLQLMSCVSVTPCVTVCSGYELPHCWCIPTCAFRTQNRSLVLAQCMCMFDYAPRGSIHLTQTPPRAEN